MTKQMRGIHTVFVPLCIMGIALPLHIVSAAISVNTNTQSINAINKLNATMKNLQRSFDRLSNGLRINSAADDAAGLGVGELTDLDARNVQQAMRDTNDGISLIQTAEGAANEVANILKRMRELATQSASETLADDERGYITDEFDQLKEKVDALSSDGVTAFNGQSGREQVASPLIQKSQDIFTNRLHAINEQIQDIDIENTDFQENPPEEQFNALSKSLTSALSEVTNIATVIIRNSDKTVRSSERKIQTLEQQRKKLLKAKPKPKPKPKK